MPYDKRKKYIITRDSLIYYDDSPVIAHSTAMGIVKVKEATELGFVWGCRVATSQDLERIEEYHLSEQAEEMHRYNSMFNN